MVGLRAEKVDKSKTLAVFGLVLIALMAVSLITTRPAHAATLTVDRTDDPPLTTIPAAGPCTSTANDCSLRWALEEANQNGQSDTINFADGLSGTIALTGGNLTIANDVIGPDLTITGPAASRISVSGNNASLVFLVNSGVTATLDRLTITKGFHLAGGGIETFGSQLTITNSTLSGNSADQGGGIQNEGGGQLNLINSTVSGNDAAFNGGGVRLYSGELRMTNSTVSFNRAYSGGGVAGGGTLLNTIVANNEATSGGPDAYGTYTSQGNNLIGNTLGSSGFGASDRLNINPLLGPLQNNGGPTDTHALLSGSPAIDAVSTGCPPPTTDQRGVGRPLDGDGNGTAFCDIGAFELEDTQPPSTPVITSPPNNSYDRDGAFTLSGTAEANSTVKIYEGSTLKGTVTASSSGAWSKALSGVTNGKHSYTATATDKGGNVSAPSAARTIIVDSVRPTGTLSINNGATTTKSRTVTLYTRASDPAPASGVAYMRFRNYPSTTWSGWFPYASSKSWILTAGAGTKYVYVQYKDRAGNVSTQAYDSIKYAP